ncbi:MAG: Methyltransferase TM1293 [Brockia lithotrophica]|uniref:Methyltransferase TM1293 n=1 Tax=Brockia lithotrophica TaxID=933949 RepID=A0A2T5GAA5_9BACL|nr:MAG: Methyltransferase TM1293 [Brockia lithotrophica]
MADAERFSHDPFAPFAESYDAWFSTPLGAYADRVEKTLLRQALDPLPGEEFLEVGSGTGHHALWLAARGVRVVGVEPSAAMRRVAEGKVARAPGEVRDRVRFLAGVGERLPFSEASFSAAYAVTALEFVADPAAVVREMWRVLAPGGRLVVGAIAGDGAWGELYREKGRDPESVYHGARFFTEAELRALVRDLPGAGRPWVLRGLYVSPSVREPAGRACLDELEAQGEGRERPGFLVVRVEKMG